MIIILLTIICSSFIFNCYFYREYKYQLGRFNFKYDIDEVERIMNWKDINEKDGVIFLWGLGYHREYNEEVWNNYCRKKEHYNLSIIH